MVDLPTPVFAALALLGGEAPAAVAPPPPAAAVVRPVESFPFYSSKNRMLVIARFKGGAPAPLVFDTGTNGNIIDTAFARSIGLPNVGPSNSVDGATGKPIPGFRTRITGMSVGGVPIEDGPANVIDFKRHDEAGIIGPNSFPGRLVEIDFAGSRIRVLPDAAANRPAGEGAPHLDGLPAVVVTVAGQSFEALVDTGNDAALTLPLSMAKTLPLKAPPVLKGKTRSAGGVQDAYEAQIDGPVRVGHLVLESPRVYFNETGDPNVGMPVLRQARLVVDHSGGRTWLEPVP